MRTYPVFCTVFFGMALSVLTHAGTSHAESLIVLEARKIALRPGQVVDSTKPLVLKEGEYVSLISPAGRTLKLEGPYNKSPDTDQSGGVSAANALALLVTQRQARVGEVGTTRGLAPNTLPDPWVLDTTRTGAVCLQEGSVAVLWRPNAATETELSLTPTDRSWRADALWPAGTDRIEVPAPAQIRPGTTYLVTVNGTQSALRVEPVPKLLENVSMRLAWLVGKGCEAQAEALLRQAE